jgi:hypothetical protein
MRKIIFLLIGCSILVSGCVRITDLTDNGGPAVSLVDSTLTNPVFTNGYNAPGSSNGEFCLAKSSTQLKVFFTFSGINVGQVSAVTLTGTSFSGITAIESNFYPISTVDACYDTDFNCYRVVHCYDAGGWPPNGTVTCTSYDGVSTSDFYIDDQVPDLVRLVKCGNTYYQFSLNTGADKIFYKKINFTGTFSQTVTPVYTGSFNSSVFSDNNFPFETFKDMKTAYNPTTGDAVIGYNWVSVSSNAFYTITADGTIHGNIFKYKDDGSHANNFDVAPIGNLFLLAYESNWDIAQQNNGNHLLTGEHIRLSLIDGSILNVSPHLGGNNPAYITSENSVALPQLIGSSNQVTGIALAPIDGTSEVGLSFIRDNNLYFTRVLIESGKLRIAPISTLAASISVNVEQMKSIYFNGKFYIVISFLGGDFEVYTSV